MRPVLALVISILFAGCTGIPGARTEEPNASTTAPDHPTAAANNETSTCASSPARSGANYESSETTVQYRNYTEKASERDGVVDCYRVDRRDGEDPLVPRRGALTTIELVKVDVIPAGMSVAGLALTLHNTGDEDVRVDKALVTEGDVTHDDLGAFGERVPAGETRVIDIHGEGMVRPAGTPMLVQVGFDAAPHVEASFEPRVAWAIDVFPNVTWTDDGRLSTVPIRVRNLGNFPMTALDFVVTLGGESSKTWKDLEVGVGRSAWAILDSTSLGPAGMRDPRVDVALLGPDETPVANGSARLLSPDVSVSTATVSIGGGTGWAWLESLNVTLQNSAATPTSVRLASMSMDGVRHDMSGEGFGDIVPHGITTIGSTFFWIDVPSDPFDLTLLFESWDGVPLAPFTLRVSPPTDASPEEEG